MNQYPSPYAYVGNNPVSLVDPTGMGGTAPDEGKTAKEEKLWWEHYDNFSAYSAANGSAPFRSSYGDATNTHLGDGFKTGNVIAEEKWNREHYTITYSYLTSESVARPSVYGQDITPYMAELVVTEHNVSIYMGEPTNDPEGAIGFLSNYIGAAATGPGYKTALMKQLFDQGQRLTKSYDVVKLTTSGKSILSSISSLSRISNGITTLAAIPTLISNGAAFLDGSFNFSNVVDLLITGTIIGVGIVGSPAVVVAAGVAGIAYGSARLVQGKEIDKSINQAIGWH